MLNLWNQNSIDIQLPTKLFIHTFTKLCNCFDYLKTWFVPSDVSWGCEIFKLTSIFNKCPNSTSPSFILEMQKHKNIKFTRGMNNSVVNCVLQTDVAAEAHCTVPILLRSKLHYGKFHSCFLGSGRLCIVRGNRVDRACELIIIE